ncbi:hypothetical protein L9F63_018995, partial [Diploptera punctata]
MILKLNVKLLRLAGMLDCQYTWYPILVYSLYIPVMMSQLYALYQYWGNMDATIENIVLMLCYTLCFGQAAFCLFHRQDIQRIVNYIENKPAQDILKKAKVTSDKMGWFLIIISNAVVISWTMTPLISYYTQTAERKIERDPNEPFPYFCIMMVLPFDVTYSPVYELIYLLQVFIQAMATIYNMAVSAFMVSTIMHTAAYFTALASSFNKLGNADYLMLECDTNIEEESMKYVTKSEISDKIEVIENPEIYLDRCIREHQDIL